MLACEWACTAARGPLGTTHSVLLSSAGISSALTAPHGLRQSNGPLSACRAGWRRAQGWSCKGHDGGRYSPMTEGYGAAERARNDKRAKGGRCGQQRTALPGHTASITFSPAWRRASRRRVEASLNALGAPGVQSPVLVTANCTPSFNAGRLHRRERCIHPRAGR